MITNKGVERLRIKATGDSLSAGGVTIISLICSKEENWISC